MTPLDTPEAKRAPDRFRLVLEAASNALLVLDAEGRITVANPHAAGLFGYECQELAGRAIDSLVVGLAAGENVGATPRREARGRRKDGSQFALALTVQPIDGGDGMAALVCVDDLDERAQTEALLQQERAFLRQIIDIDPNLIFAKDREGRFTLANKAVAQLYGTTVDRLIGLTDADFNANVSEVEAFRHADLDVMDTLEELFILEERVTDIEGREHFLQTVKRPIVGADGKANQVLGVATDITARKEAELEIALQRNELAHLSRVTMVAELSGSIAHELNQPLTAILSNAQAALNLLEHGESSLSEVREILQDIVSDDKRAGQVIQGLRLLLAKGEPRRDLLDANAVVRDVMRILKSDLLSAGVSATVELDPTLAPVCGDRVQLQQVFLNLVANACDAMAPFAHADRKLAISTQADGEFIRVCVSDRGHGIAPDHAPRIFEPFFTTKSHGLGMGLAICRNIAAAHGGKLWATGREGGGTVFCFTLPVHREPS